VAGSIETVITGSEGGGIAPLPAVALPSLQLYKRVMRIEEQPAALNSHKEGWSDWERFILLYLEYS
jgi:hypothetical protein